MKTGEIARGLTDATLVGGAFNSVFSWGDIGQKSVAIDISIFANYNKSARKCHLKLGGKEEKENCHGYDQKVFPPVL